MRAKNIIIPLVALAGGPGTTALLLYASIHEAANYEKLNSLPIETKIAYVEQGDAQLICESVVKDSLVPALIPNASNPIKPSDFLKGQRYHSCVFRALNL